MNQSTRERAPRDAALGEAGPTNLLPLVSPRTLVHQAEAAYRFYLELLDGVQMLTAQSS